MAEIENVFEIGRRNCLCASAWSGHAALPVELQTTHASTMARVRTPPGSGSARVWDGQEGQSAEDIDRRSHYDPWNLK